MILTKVSLSSYRVAHYNNDKNENQLRLSLDLIDKVRMDAKQRVAHYKNLITKHHDALVKPRQFNIGDLILKRVSLATKDPAHGKLGPNWEGSYRVINSKRRGSYYLEALDERKLEHPWNVEHLKEVLPVKKTRREGQHGQDERLLVITSSLFMLSFGTYVFQ